MLKLRVPATSANLGPGFDCLALALDLWNEVSFEEGERFEYKVTGEGAPQLNGQADNLLVRAFRETYRVCGRAVPAGMKIVAHNGIPVGSGLGSSAAAIVTGLVAANHFLGSPLGEAGLLRLAAGLEGHPDNAAAALLGGLVVTIVEDGEVIARRYGVAALSVVVAVPEADWPTGLARSVLPASYPLADAVYNLGRTPLVVEALRAGDLALLQQVMDDRLHQPYRLGRIPGAEGALRAARERGAAALSGAGPGVIAFVSPDSAEDVRTSMISAFAAAGVRARGFITASTPRGIQQV